jgi:hypothetical protein
MRMRFDALPYVPAPAEHISVGGWQTPFGQLGDHLDDWDPDTDLHLGRTLTIDAAAIRRDCQLADQIRLAVLPLARSERTGLRIAGRLSPVDNQADRTTVALHLSGSALGGTVTLTTSLVVLDVDTSQRLSPQVPGAELWKDQTRVDLEGSAPRFPVSPVHFPDIPTLEPDAGWTLDWQPGNLDEPALGAIRLLINTANPRIAAALVTGSDDMIADVVRGTIRHDVARTLILAALANDDFITDQDAYREGSVGRAIKDLISLNWVDDLAVLAARSRNDPRRFQMELQTRFPPIPPAA